MEKFKGKYRTTTFRASWWNYGNSGSYFITITTQNFVCYFGDVVNKKMILNDTGQLIDKLINEIPSQFDFAKLGPYVIMPNHIHLIIEIDKINYGNDVHSDNTQLNMDDAQLDIVDTRLDSVDARLIAHLQNEQIKPSNKTGGITGTHNPMLHDNIPRIIRWFKGRTTFEIRKIDKTFKWQRLYYDVIIRDQLMLKNITFYINNNPSRWELKNKQ